MILSQLELMWQFVALANTVYERCDNSSRAVMSTFHAACHDLGEIASIAKVHPEILAGLPTKRFRIWDRRLPFRRSEKKMLRAAPPGSPIAAIPPQPFTGFKIRWFFSMRAIWCRLVRFDHKRGGP